MSRTALRKRTPRRAGYGQARPVTWDNEIDLVLRGFWLHETQQIRIEVPIFQHAFHPKVNHTDLDIKQNIMYRSIVLPSLSEIRQHGITVEKAAVIAEVVVHPRYIKNHNYFRGDFPALVKGIAKRDDVLIILPANDMPTARLKRKHVLGFLRMAFTPLFLKGKHYTSGRMGMYMAAPPGAAKKFQASFNFGEADEKVRDTVNEWHPSVNRVRQPRKRGPKPLYNRRQQQIAAEVIAETSERLKTDLFPIVVDKLNLQKGSAPAQEIEAWLSAPATSRELVKRTKGKNRAAVKAWVNQVMMPKLKTIVSDEVADIANVTARWAVRQMFTASIAMLLDMVQASFGEEPGFIGRTVQKVKYDPTVDPATVAAGNLTFLGTRTGNEAEQKRRIFEKVKEMYVAMTHEYNVNVERVFTVDVSPRATVPVKITLNVWKLGRTAQYSPSVLGSLAKGNKVDRSRLANIKTRILPEMNREILAWYKEGMPSGYGMM